jgi:hypothetical protein
MLGIGALAVGNLASRKLFAALAPMLLMALNKRLDLGLTPDDILYITGLAGAVIGTQAGIDALKTYREGK